MTAFPDKRYVLVQLGDGAPPPSADSRPATPEEREAILRRLRRRMRGQVDFPGALNGAVNSGGFLRG